MAASARWDRLWVNVRLATMVEGGAPYGAVESGALAITNGLIAFVGRAADLPSGHSASEVIDAGGRWLTPGLIDCHTHIVFGGDRIDEFEARLTGSSYEQIARAGGGILSTVRATRAASEDELVESAAPRLRQLIADGVTTVEIKSGYGLDTDNELKMLRVARRLGRELPIDVRTTFLGAHALPPEFAHDRSGYLDLVCNEMLPSAAEQGLVDAVDAFCETIGFTEHETARLFDTAARLGIKVKLHADQLSDGGGAELAARYRALSADHVEWTSPEGVSAMKEAGTVAVLLPGAFHTLRETRLPPIDAFRATGVPMAVATDCNPGTSPARSMLLMLNLACTLFRLTPEEALAGVTRNAAKALGLDDRGTLEVAKRADLVVWDITSPAELCYWLGGRPELSVIRAA